LPQQSPDENCVAKNGYLNRIPRLAAVQQNLREILAADGIPAVSRLAQSAFSK
jgi:hypothetical protein